MKTPLKVRISFGDCADTQVGKFSVIETTFLILFQQASNTNVSSGLEASQGKYCALELPMSPQVRGAASGTAETLLEILKTTAQPPEGVHNTYTHIVRLSEADEGSANNRMESLLLLKARPEPWVTMRLLCLGRKFHAAAVKSWSLESEAVSNLIHSIKVLTMAGSLARIKAAIRTLVSQRLRIIDASPNRFCQRAAQRKSVAIFCSTLQPSKTASHGAIGNAILQQQVAQAWSD